MELTFKYVYLKAIANSVQRVRKRECSKPKFPGLLKTTLCIEKEQNAVHNLIANVTSRLSVIENRVNDLNEKTTSICCMIGEIENNIRILLGPLCPTESLIIIRLYRSVIEDVNELICRSPKCEGLLRGYKIPKTNNISGIISIMLRIVFSLGD